MPPSRSSLSSGTVGRYFPLLVTFSLLSLLSFSPSAACRRPPSSLPETTANTVTIIVGQIHSCEKPTLPVLPRPSLSSRSAASVTSHSRNTAASFFSRIRRHLQQTLPQHLQHSTPSQINSPIRTTNYRHLAYSRRKSPLPALSSPDLPLSPLSTCAAASDLHTRRLTADPPPFAIIDCPPIFQICSRRPPLHRHNSDGHGSPPQPLPFSLVLMHTQYSNTTTTV